MKCPHPYCKLCALFSKKKGCKVPVDCVYLFTVPPFHKSKTNVFFIFCGQFGVVYRIISKVLYSTVVPVTLYHCQTLSFVPNTETLFEKNKYILLFIMMLSCALELKC